MYKFKDRYASIPRYLNWSNSVVKACRAPKKPGAAPLARAVRIVPEEIQKKQETAVKACKEELIVTTFIKAVT